MLVPYIVLIELPHKPLPVLMDERYVNTSAAPGTGTGTTIRGSSVSEQPAPPQLSCALCRDRKLKCDKLDPCTNCSSSGVICVPVYRRRLPRGRHAHKNTPWNSSPPPPPSFLGNSNPVPASNVTSPTQTDCLNERIRRLESLLLEAGSTTAGAGQNAAKASEESRELVSEASWLTLLFVHDDHVELIRKTNLN